tara:strand:+ start:56 stop:232 length:177 start_codon:yes stop_codon:yes gene_type:complete
MKCPKCSTELKKIKVKIQDAKSLVQSYQCLNCNYFDLGEVTTKRAIEEIKTKTITLKN